MARKHLISPNQTVIWAYQALAPEWGSPALRHPQERRKRPRRTAKKGSRTTTDLRARKSAGRSRWKDFNASALSALTATEGVCAQAKHSQCRVRGTGARGSDRPRRGVDDLV
jgi:hypothetical protein